MKKLGFGSRTETVYETFRECGFVASAVINSGIPQRILLYLLADSIAVPTLSRSVAHGTSVPTTRTKPGITHIRDRQKLGKYVEDTGSKILCSSVNAPVGIRNLAWQSM